MIGCLIIHGFTGSPLELKPLTEYLQNHFTWRFEVPTLPGHGEQDSWDGIKYTKWIEGAEDSLHKLMQHCDEIYVIGFSMGGIIATYLAANYPVKKLVLLSAAVYYISPKHLALEVVDLLGNLRKGTYRDNQIYSRFVNKFKTTPLAITREFQKLVHKNIHLFTQITIPVFIAQGLKDGIIAPQSASYIYKKIASEDKTIMWIDNSGHLICYCEEQDELFKQIIQFLEKE